MGSLCVIFDLQKIQQWALSLRYFLSTKNSTMGSLCVIFDLQKNSRMGSLCAIFDLQKFNNGLSLRYF